MKVAKRPLYSILLFSSFFSALFLRMTHCDLTDGQGRCKRSERRRRVGLLTAAEYKKWLSYVIRLRVRAHLKKKLPLFLFSLLKTTCHSALKVGEALMEKWGPRSSDGKMCPSPCDLYLLYLTMMSIQKSWPLVKAVKRPFPSKAFFGYVSKPEMIASTVGLLLE